MKTIKFLLSVFLLTAYMQVGNSQNTVSYGYDAAGNIVSRSIVMLRSAEPDPEESPVIYSEMLSDIKLNIYPNPTEGFLKVEIQNLPENQTADIFLYNLSGQLITVRKGVTDYEEIDISDQSTGNYVMKIIAGEYQTEWKIIKK